MVLQTLGFSNAEPESSTEVVGILPNSINVEDIKYETYTIGDIPGGELPELPIGFFYTGADGHEQKITKYSVVPDVDMGNYSLILGLKENQGSQKVIETLSSFLGEVIDKIGDYSPKVIAQSMKISVTKLFSQMYLADITTMIFGVRMAAIGREIACNVECPAPCNTMCRDNPKEGRDLHSLDVVKIRSMTGIDTKPLFRFELPIGVYDGESTIKNLYFQPLKFEDLSYFMQSGKPTVSDVQLAIAMISDIPESKRYNMVRGKKFSIELYKSMRAADAGALIQAMQRIQPGLEPSFKVSCVCGQKELDYAVQWAQNARNFIFFSNLPVVEEI